MTDDNNSDDVGNLSIFSTFKKFSTLFHKTFVVFARAMVRADDETGLVPRINVIVSECLLSVSCSRSIHKFSAQS